MSSIARWTKHQIANSGHAKARDLVVISKDEDFLHLANRPNDTGTLLWVRIGNCRKEKLLNDVSMAFPKAVQALAEGYRILELR